jgi:hypothetical protein
VKLTEFFDAIFVINLERRSDRWLECLTEFHAAGIPQYRITKWKASESGPTPQSCGTRSHREILRHIVENNIKCALVLEDDFQAITVPMLKEAGHIRGRRVLDAHCSILDGEGTFAERFEALIPFIPPDFDFLYLGGGYGEAPISRYNKHMIRCRTMKGTHAYGVTWKAAKNWTAWIDERTKGDLDHNCGAADDMITAASHFMRFYCVEPRLLTQRPSYSDLSKTTVSYLDSFTNPDHVVALDSQG